MNFYISKWERNIVEQEGKIGIVDAAENMRTICLPRLYVVVAGLASDVSGLSGLFVQSPLTRLDE